MKRKDKSWIDYKTKQMVEMEEWNEETVIKKTTMVRKKGKRNKQEGGVESKKVLNK